MLPKKEKKAPFVPPPSHSMNNGGSSSLSGGTPNGMVRQGYQGERTTSIGSEGASVSDSGTNTSSGNIQGQGHPVGPDGQPIVKTGRKRVLGPDGKPMKKVKVPGRGQAWRKGLGGVGTGSAAPKVRSLVLPSLASISSLELQTLTSFRSFFASKPLSSRLPSNSSPLPLDLLDPRNPRRSRTPKTPTVDLGLDQPTVEGTTEEVGTEVVVEAEEALTTTSTTTTTPIPPVRTTGTETTTTRCLKERSFRKLPSRRFPSRGRIRRRYVFDLSLSRRASSVQVFRR